MVRPRWLHLPLGRRRQADLDILGQIFSENLLTQHGPSHTSIPLRGDALAPIRRLAGGPNPCAELLRQLDDDPLRAHDVAEPVAVFVALQFANELRAAGSQAGDDSVDVVELRLLESSDVSQRVSAPGGSVSIGGSLSGKRLPRLGLTQGAPLFQSRWFTMLITLPSGARTKNRRTPHGSVVIGCTIS